MAWCYWECLFSENVKKSLEPSNSSQSFEDIIGHTTSALAPTLLPMIEQLGALSEEDLYERSLE